MTIYSMADPITGEIRYVGATTLTLSERLRDHLTACHARPDAPVYQWLARLKALGLEPTMLALEETDDKKAEGRWIKRFLEAGQNLLNETSTGSVGRGI